MSSPFFSESDFKALLGIKGERVQVRFPAIETPAQPEYGLPSRIGNNAVEIPVLIEDKTTSIKIVEGVVRPGDLSVYIGASFIPVLLPAQTTISYRGVVYQPEEEPPILVKGKIEVRKFKLQKIANLAPRLAEHPEGDRINRVSQLPGF
jgi:hypothetical protein